MAAPSRAQSSAISEQQKTAHWSKTRNLMIVHLIIWFVFAYLVHWFAPELNRFNVFGFPLGYYMAAQGSLFAFVIQLFVFVWQQDRVDREFGLAEADDM